MKKDTKDEKEEFKIEPFLIKNVLTTAELSAMSKKGLHRHIKYLEKVALGLNHGLTIAIEQLNIKKRAITGELV